jgi:hypothetical protein
MNETEKQLYLGMKHNNFCMKDIETMKEEIQDQKDLGATIVTRANIGTKKATCNLDNGIRVTVEKAVK